MDNSTNHNHQLRGLIPDPKNYQNVPAGLRAERSFIFWKLVWDERMDKFTKKPVNPKTLRFGGQNDPDCFIDFSQAIKALTAQSKKPIETRDFHGIGLAFSGTDLIALDLIMYMTRRVN